MANQPPLTRGEVITQGLEQGRNPGLVAKARIFLNLFEDHLIRTTNLRKFEKESSELTLASGGSTLDISSISDLGHIIDVWLEDGTQPLPMVALGDLWAERRLNVEESQTGRPCKVTYDVANSQLMFNIPTDQVYKIRLLYASVPAMPDTSNTSAYDAAAINWPDSWGLVAAIQEFARMWDSHSMLQIAMVLRADAIQSARIAEQTEMWSGDNQMGLNDNVFGWWRQD